MNVTGFYTSYDNLQATSNVLNSTANPPALQATLLNVGTIETKGVEIESSSRPLSWLKLDASFAYVDATITSFPDGQCYAGQTRGPGTDCVNIATGTQPANYVQNLAGHGLPNAPKFKTTEGASVDYPLGESGYRLIATGDYQYQSTVHFDLFDSPLTYEKGYGLLNGGIGIAKNNTSLKFFVNNLFDKHYAVFLTDAYSSFGNYHVVEQNLTRDSERYFGLLFSTKY